MGVDKIRASVNVDYDQATTDRKAREVRSGGQCAAERSEDRRPVRVEALRAVGGVPGPAAISLRRRKRTGSCCGCDRRCRRPRHRTYGVNKTETHTVVPAGRIQRVSAAILVDDAIVKTVQGGKTTFKKVKRSPEELTEDQGACAGGDWIRCQARRHHQRAEYVLRYHSGPGRYPCTESGG